MQVFLPFDLVGEVRQLLLRAGYHEYNDVNTGQTSYIRRLHGDFYPRFHVYVETRDGRAGLNLHLDQKKPSYPGAHAHAADYDGSVVETEAERIKSAITQRQAQPSRDTASSTRWWEKFFN